MNITIDDGWNIYIFKLVELEINKEQPSCDCTKFK